MTIRSETGGVRDVRIVLGAHPAHQTIHGLSQTVDLAFHVTGKTRLQVTVEAIDARVSRRLPTRIIGIHNMAGIAKARLPGDHNRPGGKQRKDHKQQ